MLYLIPLTLLLLLPLLYYLWRWWRRTRPPPQELYICLDGHLVRSRGEWMIDASLQYLGIAHEYEPRVELGGQVLHPDFGLGNRTYIEYWGMRTLDYRQVRQQKERRYKMNQVKLIDIENADLKNLPYILKKKLSLREN